MDVLVHRVENGFVRSVFRKPTFFGLFTTWDFYEPTNQKINLIKSLTTRAVRICSPSTMDHELRTLQELFVKNGYPLHLVETTIKQTVQNIKEPRRMDTDRHAVSIQNTNDKDIRNMDKNKHNEHMTQTIND